MPPANIESDPLFVLLTDALRAGPGTSQWQDAVTALREKGVDGSDEHKLLIQTRENLEAGREYRAVRAGPGFTRKVMAEIENEKSPAGKRTGVPTATLVAIFCGLVILSAVGYVIWRMSPPPLTNQAMIDDLENKSQGFVDQAAIANFAGATPDGWQTIGTLKLSAADGLRPDATADQENKSLGGGVVLKKSLLPTQAFAVDVTIHNATPTPAILVEAFVTTDNTFSPEKGTSSHDLVWQLRGKDEQVLLNGNGKLLVTPPAFQPGDIVRLLVAKDVAIVEVVPAAGGKPLRLWAGSHELGAGPRYIGVRFLQAGPGAKPDVSVQQIKVTTAAGN